MKFINYLKDITGVSIYPLISLFIFVIFFIGVAWYVYSADKRTLQDKSRLPLDS